MTLSLARPQLVDLKPDDHAGRRQVEAWLGAYAAGRDPELRDQILRAYLGMADRLAERFRRSRNTSPDDLRQAARLGLLTAIDRYDPDRSDRFVAYAVACVVGELKRHLRDTTWQVAVPRQTKELALRVCRAADELAGELGRSPTAADVADALDLDEELVREAMGAARSRLQASLDEPLGNGPDTGLADLLADDAPDDREDLILLPQLLAALPEPERTVVWLYYYEERTQREIGELTGRCQMSVSRLLRRAVHRLRGELLGANPDTVDTKAC
jgi:RNA polymerase sigma-B factor